MLSILFTKKKLLFGANLDTARFLSLDGEREWPFEGQSPSELLSRHLDAMVHSYTALAHEKGISLPRPLPVALAFPVDMERRRAEYEKVLAVVDSYGGGMLKVVHWDNLALAYLHGQASKGESDHYAILEAIDDYAHLCYVQKNAAAADARELGAAAVKAGERFEFQAYREFGRSHGNEKVLNELLTEFHNAGLNVDMPGQTELALQLLSPKPEHVYTVSKHTRSVNIEAEIRLDPARYEELMTTGREKIGEHLTPRALSGRGVGQVLLLGRYLQNDLLKRYFGSELGLNGSLAKVADTEDEFETILRGLGLRAQEAVEAEEIRIAEIRRREEEEARRQAEAEARRREEEAKRAKIQADLKVKEERDALLEELQRTCVDPELKEEYEETFISRGARLGIPDVVIRWNISEVLSRIELEAEKVAVGIEAPAAQPVAPVEPPVVVAAPAEPVVLPAEITPAPVEEIVEEEQWEEAAAEVPVSEPIIDEPVVNKADLSWGESPAEDLSVPEPEPVLVTETTAATVQTTQAEPTKDKKAPLISLNDIFVIKGALPDHEFAMKKVTFHADSEMKVVRLLPIKDREQENKFARFQKLYEKELKYYGDMSEITESKEGLYYYRDYLERSTLKDHVKRLGLDKKLKLEDLSSTDLKFILQIFKEVRELPVPHADLNEETILVLSKRKWNLQKNVEIRFVGFTADDATPEEMIEMTHAAFGRMMGETFYKDFREKFQL
ncbi:MAG: hypothetical protein OHK0039_38510 [Bacteroidia bacterium]